MTETAAKILLLTNDDGVDAPGLSALQSACKGLGESRVIAPFGPYSSCSHTITTHKPLVVHRRDDGRIAVEGAPADCVRVAIDRLLPGLSWVVSGINRGGNLGCDTFHSGTVAAVREAALHGRPGIAVSQYLAGRDRPLDWERSARLASRVVARLLAKPCGPGEFWNVNLPHLLPDEPDPEVVECPLDLSPLPVAFRWEHEGLAHYSGDYQSRARVPGRDVDVCFSGRIAVTRMSLD